MSAELPELERLIADAAERHYSARRPWRLPAPRLSLVAGLVAAAAAVVLAIVILPLRSDEQSASPPGVANPAAPLAKRYAIFARGQQDVGARAFAIAEDQLRALAPQTPVAVRMLRSFDDGGIVAAAGTSRIGGEPAVCLSEQHTHTGGGGCIDVADLPADEPWFTFGVPGHSDTTVTALVPDAVTAMSMELASGATRNVPIENNLAYARAGETVCSVRWETESSGGGSGHSLPGC
jgi:hypothetical protein